MNQHTLTHCCYNIPMLASLLLLLDDEEAGVVLGLLQRRRDLDRDRDAWAGLRES